ncbi:MAG: hypothetical protein IKC49_01025, partial [Clostridia bacterium]|nr:hypothetical protein [Clostridia bacterium]
HSLISPNNTLDRYIAYDYFKADNVPKVINDSFPIDLNISLDKSGIIMTLHTIRNKTYNIIREENNHQTVIKQIHESDGEVIIKDHDVFRYDELSYFITDENAQIISNIKKIRPKDYLISLLTNNIINNKKKWYI